MGILNKFLSMFSTEDRDSDNELQRDKNIREARRQFFDDITRKTERVNDIAGNLKPGDLSDNTNWIGIETIGHEVGPHGDDTEHTVIISKSARHSGNIEVARIKCTNYVYSEWITCLCETMWHTKSKILEDIHGRKYPLGKMLEMTATVTYEN